MRCPRRSGGAWCPRPSSGSDLWVWDRCSCSSRPTSTSTTSRCWNVRSTTTRSRRCVPSTSSSTTGTARPATAFSHRRGGSGASTTACASTPTPSCAPSSGTSRPAHPARSDGGRDARRPRSARSAAAADRHRRGRGVGGSRRGDAQEPGVPGDALRQGVSMAARLTVADLVDLGDLDELLRRVDDLCDAGDWAGLLDLRDRCRAAFERGRQLWPAASHAEYRLALQAPGRWAAQVIVPGAGRFALGPLSEVVASTHSWDELAAHLGATPEAALVAQGRVLRGEDLRGDARVDTAVVELPLALEPWEPDYPRATYKPYTAEFADVAPPPTWETVDVMAADRDGTVDEGARALLDLVTPWTTQ